MKLGVLGLLWLTVCACDDDVLSPAGSSPSAGGTASGSAAASAAPTSTASSGKSKCEELSEEVWELVADAPKACKKVEDCVIVGPATCRAAGSKKSCVAGIAKGYEGPIDAASKRWEATGCDKGLPEVENERLVCKAGQCTVLFKRR